MFQMCKIFHQLSSLCRTAVEAEEFLKVIKHDNKNRFPVAQVRPCVNLLGSIVTDSEFCIWEFLDQLRNYQPLQADSTPWSTLCVKTIPNAQKLISFYTQNRVPKCMYKFLFSLIYWVLFSDTDAALFCYFRNI